MWSKRTINKEVAVEEDEDEEGEEKEGHVIEIVVAVAACHEDQIRHN